MSRYWYEKAARKGNIDAIFNLALDDVRRNPARARRLYQQAALRGDLYSQTNLAVMLLDGEGGKTDTAAGFRWMRKAAQRGDDKAQYNLGRAYTDGEDIQKNYSLAKKWLSKAAKLGHYRALRLLKSLRKKGV